VLIIIEFFTVFVVNLLNPMCLVFHSNSYCISHFIYLNVTTKPKVVELVNRYFGLKQDVVSFAVKYKIINMHPSI